MKEGKNENEQNTLADKCRKKRKILLNGYVSTATELKRQTKPYSAMCEK